MYAFGFTIDSLMNACKGLPAFLASAGRLSRSGPIFPVAPAGLKVWQLEQPFAAKAALPPAPAELPCFACFTHAANFPGVITTACERISAWPRPHSSVQMSG